MKYILHYKKPLVVSKKNAGKDGARAFETRRRRNVSCTSIKEHRSVSIICATWHITSE